MGKTKLLFSQINSQNFWLLFVRVIIFYPKSENYRANKWSNMIFFIELIKSISGGNDDDNMAENSHIYYKKSLQVQDISFIKCLFSLIPEIRQ